MMFINIDTSRVAAVKQKPGDVVFAKAALQITLLHAGTPQGLFCVARSAKQNGGWGVRRIRLEHSDSDYLFDVAESFNPTVHPTSGWALYAFDPSRIRRREWQVIRDLRRLWAMRSRSPRVSSWPPWVRRANRLL